MTDTKRREYQKQYHKDYQYTETRKRVSASLSEREKELFDYLAEQQGLKPATLASNILRSYINKDPLVSKPLEEELRGVKRAILNVANNVNQIAHRSNYLKVMVDEGKLLQELQRLEKIVHEFVEDKVGK